mmetsp:Transcript_45965/g.78194  ORF Transcript_45965/g.78194 Transcript_45965/m.78194 type:complete len:219 (-) Transcript_45965:715-1371(-)
MSAPPTRNQQPGALLQPHFQAFETCQSKQLLGLGMVLLVLVISLEKVNSARWQPTWVSSLLWSQQLSRTAVPLCSTPSTPRRCSRASLRWKQTTRSEARWGGPEVERRCRNGLRPFLAPFEVHASLKATKAEVLPTKVELLITPLIGKATQAQQRNLLLLLLLLPALPALVLRISTSRVLRRPTSPCASCVMGASWPLNSVQLSTTKSKSLRRAAGWR